MSALSGLSTQESSEQQYDILLRKLFQDHGVAVCFAVAMPQTGHCNARAVLTVSVGTRGLKGGSSCLVLPEFIKARARLSPCEALGCRVTESYSLKLKAVRFASPAHECFYQTNPQGKSRPSKDEVVRRANCSIFMCSRSANSKLYFGVPTPQESVARPQRSSAHKIRTGFPSPGNGSHLSLSFQ